MKIYNGYERLPRNYTALADEYEYTMSYGYFVNGKGDLEAVFDVFFRKVPNDGGYAIMAGLDKIIEYIKNIIKIPRIKLIIQLISKKYKTIIFDVLENLEKGDYGSEVITIKDFFNN